MRQVLESRTTGAVGIRLQDVLTVWREASQDGDALCRANEQGELYSRDQPRGTQATQPKEDDMTNYGESECAR